MTTLKIYDFVEYCTRGQYASVSRQNLLNFVPVPKQHVILVTNLLVHAEIEHIMSHIKATDFTWEIRTLGINLWSWITIDDIYEYIGNYEPTDILIIPDRTIGSDEDLQKMVGIKVFRGPKSYTELSLLISAHDKEEEVPVQLTNPKIAIMGPPGCYKTEIARKLAKNYNIPLIDPIELIAQGVNAQDSLCIRAQEYIDRNALIPHYITAEIVRNKLTQEDSKHGYILDGYPKTPKDVQWLKELHNSLDIVVNIQMDHKICMKNLKHKLDQDQINTIFGNFSKETQKVIDYYSTTKRIINVDANQLYQREILNKIENEIDNRLRSQNSEIPHVGYENYYQPALVQIG